MAVDVCSEISSPVMVSPRISFSHDLKELDFVPVESPHQARSDALLLNSAIDFDFDFCIGPHEISSADDLFANGKILPVQIKKTTIPPKEIYQPKPHKNVEFANETTKKKRLIEFLASSFDADDEEEKPLTKPFWQFRKSSSVNCDNGRSSSNGLLRSLQFLTRSNSTGSAPNPKPSPFPKVMQKQQSMKEASSIHRSSSSVPSFNQYYPYNDNLSKKPSLRKSTSRSYGNGVRISPVLNIPPTYIAKGTVSLLGIGSFFCSKKSKKKRK